jgi:hypothetical protein
MGGGELDGGWTLFECYDQKEFAHVLVVCLQRWGAVGRTSDQRLEMMHWDLPWILSVSLILERTDILLNLWTGGWQRRLRSTHEKLLFRTAYLTLPNLKSARMDWSWALFTPITASFSWAVAAVSAWRAYSRSSLALSSNSLAVSAVSIRLYIRSVSLDIQFSMVMYITTYRTDCVTIHIQVRL